uniref:Uncharacterized protein n=1 Tax=Anguilla anguilla TaxID=7936 RepID=A0A0E9UFM9_ANGAN
MLISIQRSAFSPQQDHIRELYLQLNNKLKVQTFFL